MTTSNTYDVIVVGAGIGGIYALHRFRAKGLSVLGLEAGSDVGGVWHHNRYPGARVDVDSLDYCYYFSPELYNDWKWTERYAGHAEIRRYLSEVANRFDVTKLIRFDTRVIGAQWNPITKRYLVTTNNEETFNCRFLVMTTGNLSAPRPPDFAGLENFQGEWVQTSRWPAREVALSGRRIGVVGTGSSGIQTIPVLAELAAELLVFQRTPNYCVPAQNGPPDEALWMEVKADVPAARTRLLASGGGSHIVAGTLPSTHFSDAERTALMQQQWEYGGQAFGRIFSDQSTNVQANTYVADFVRAKIRAIVADPTVAEQLCPFDHPIGSRRLCLGTNYYESYNRDNVSLINLRREKIDHITTTGIRTSKSHYDLDLIVFALGFDAFSGAIDAAGIRNEHGHSPTDSWSRGPATYLGLMTAGFPNLFIVTGPGSPSVLANMTLANEQHIDWIAACIEHLDGHGLATVEPSEQAQRDWGTQVAHVAAPLLRLRVNNYMVHVNSDDQSRVFIPYAGGFGKYVAHCDAVAAAGYPGLIMA